MRCRAGARAPIYKVPRAHADPVHGVLGGSAVRILAQTFRGGPFLIGQTEEGIYEWPSLIPEVSIRVYPKPARQYLPVWGDGTEEGDIQRMQLPAVYERAGKPACAAAGAVRRHGS